MRRSMEAIFGFLLALLLPASSGFSPRIHTTKIYSNSNSDSILSPENLELLLSHPNIDNSLLRSLINSPAQSHLFSNWPPLGTGDGSKISLVSQLTSLSNAYPKGLLSYLETAESLLHAASKNINPFDTYVPSVPKGRVIEHDSPAFSQYEAQGVGALQSSAFVIVAGGLGERLGYSGIKLSLESNLCDNKPYIQVYFEYILACQAKCEEMGCSVDGLPVVIMTSMDTDSLTRKLLDDNDYFGLRRSQVDIVVQGKVPAIKDNRGGIATVEGNQWEVQTKPAGHGVVHSLLVQNGIIKKWEEEKKISHVLFLQDTNALVVNGFLVALGVAVSEQFMMTSICVPRLAGEAAGAIAKLTDVNGDVDKDIVINVEYNQLDPLLRTDAAGGLGDVADESTGYSPYPGNCNNLVIEFESYCKALRGEDRGVVDEFVNPKYKDEARSVFKKPTRLESMMQDYPKLLNKAYGGSGSRVGFVTMDRWLTFSPAKNSLQTGIDAQSDAPSTMSSSESDFYIANARKLMDLGVEIQHGQNLGLKSNMDTSLTPIPITKGPRIVLSQHFGLTKKDLRENVVNGGYVSERSSLVIEGLGDVILDNIYVDGALEIKTRMGIELHCKGLRVVNKGWVMRKLTAEEEKEEEKAIRGYSMEKIETFVIDLRDEVDGVYEIDGKDGVVVKL